MRAVLVAVGVVISTTVSASALFTYDPVGRVATAIYNNGICVAYSYDAVGNRTAQTNGTGSTTATWGTGIYGCFVWTP